MEALFTLSPVGYALIPIVLGLVAVFRGVGLDAKYAPLASIAFASLLLFVTGLSWQECVIQGIVVGLAASGLYSGSKTTMRALSEDETPRNDETGDGPTVYNNGIVKL
jgi:hypothetical protein